MEGRFLDLLAIPTLKAQTQKHNVNCEGKPAAFWNQNRRAGQTHAGVPSHNGGDLAAAGRRPATPSLTSLTQAGSTSKPVGTETSSGDKQAKKEKGKKGKKGLTGSEDQPKVGVKCTDYVTRFLSSRPRWLGEAAKITAELGLSTTSILASHQNPPVTTGQSTIQKPASHLNFWDFVTV